VARSTGTAPTAEQLAAVACPVEGFALITRHGRDLSTLSSALAALRLVFLADALAAQHTATAIAAAAEVTVGRVSQLAKRIRPLAEES
jgi:hypothetical protein